VQLAVKGKHRFQNALHEECILDKGVNVGQLEGYMIHLNDNGYVERMRKSLQYSILESEAIVKNERVVTKFKILFGTIFQFFKKYFVQLGILDGMPGLIYSMHHAGAYFRAHALAWDALNPQKRKI
jgi:hypothetical protein